MGLLYGYVCVVYLSILKIHKLCGCFHRLLSNALMIAVAFRLNSMALDGFQSTVERCDSHSPVFSWSTLVVRLQHRYYKDGNKQDEMEEKGKIGWQEKERRRVGWANEESSSC